MVTTKNNSNPATTKSAELRRAHAAKILDKQQDSNNKTTKRPKIEQKDDAHKITHAQDNKVTHKIAAATPAKKRNAPHVTKLVIKPVAKKLLEGKQSVAITQPKIDNQKNIDNPVLKNAKIKLRRAFDKIRHALPKTTNEVLTTTKVHITEDTNYAREIAIGEHIRSTSHGLMRYKIKKMDTREAKKITAQYDSTLKILRSENGTPLSTIGFSGKGHKDYQAFVLLQDGSLRVFNHQGVYNAGGETTTHASASQGLPVVAAGLIKIENGKITAINDDSGHYQPDRGHMYLGITMIQRLMPEVMNQNTQVGLWDSHNPYTVDSFKEMMEKPSNHKDKQIPHHLVLREQKREQDQNSNTMKRRNAFLISGDSSSVEQNLEQYLNKLDPDSKQISGIIRAIKNGGKIVVATSKTAVTGKKSVQKYQEVDLEQLQSILTRVRNKNPIRIPDSIGDAIKQKKQSCTKMQRTR